MLTDLEWLCGWYRQQCDGEWEHEFGIELATLDNPGWSLSIDLTGTPLSGRAFTPEEREAGGDWLRLWKDAGAERISGACSPAMLSEMLARLRAWASDSSAERACL